MTVRCIVTSYGPREVSTTTLYEENELKISHGWLNSLEAFQLIHTRHAELYPLIAHDFLIMKFDRAPPKIYFYGQFASYCPGGLGTAVGGLGIQPGTPRLQL